MKIYFRCEYYPTENTHTPAKIMMLVTLSQTVPVSSGHGLGLNVTVKLDGKRSIPAMSSQILPLGECKDGGGPEFRIAVIDDGTRLLSSIHCIFRQCF